LSIGRGIGRGAADAAEFQLVHDLSRIGIGLRLRAINRADHRESRGQTRGKGDHRQRAHGDYSCVAAVIGQRAISFI
jgi:hypothetical protein